LPRQAGSGDGGGAAGGSGSAGNQNGSHQQQRPEAFYNVYGANVGVFSCMQHAAQPLHIYLHHHNHSLRSVELHPPRTTQTLPSNQNRNQNPTLDQTPTPQPNPRPRPTWR